MAELIRRHGGSPIIAPSMREVPLSENPQALDFLRRLEAGRIDIVIFLTGVGTRTLIEILSGVQPRERLAALLAAVTLVARGPKPVAALKEIGLAPNVAVPEPNTWREILKELDAKTEIKGKRVAVQEYGVSNVELIAGLKERGAEVIRVPVYRWALPHDVGPLRSALGRIIGGEVDAALFTNATQVNHLFQIAKGEGVEEQLKQALRRMVIASVGPICTEALSGFGLAADLEPEHPKMGHLVLALAQRGPELLATKRNPSPPTKVSPKAASKGRGGKPSRRGDRK
jgi:uroporphyrinogen-III synthase